MKQVRIAFLALLVPCAAFANVTEDINGVGVTVIPSLGLAIDVVGNTSLQSHRPGLSHSVDMGFAYAHAKHKQEIDPGDGPVIVGGTNFFTGASQDITWTSNVQLAHIGYRPRWWIGNSNFAVEGLIGLGWAGLGIKGVSTNGRSAAERLSNGGVVFGLGGLWRFAPSTALQVRSIGFGSGKDEGVTSAGRFEVTVTHQMAKNLQLRGGVGYLIATSAREDADSAVVKSPISAGGVGLTLGLDLLF